MGVRDSLHGLRAQRLPDHPQIYETFSTPASLQSSVVAALLGLCLAHLECGEPKSCMAAADAALRLSPESWQAFYARGTCFLRSGDLPQAEEDLAEAWRLRARMPKSDKEALWARIETLRQLRWEEAAAARRMLGTGTRSLDTMD